MITTLFDNNGSVKAPFKTKIMTDKQFIIYVVSLVISLISLVISICVLI